MQFTLCDYQGQLTPDGKRFDGMGQYTFANGDRYVGGMLDGVFHGHGAIFFRRRGGHGSAGPTKGVREAYRAGTTATTAIHDGTAADSKSTATATAATDDEAGLRAFLGQEPEAPAHTAGSVDEAQEWDGQLRGVWDHGRNVAGSYLFFDGLVYSSSSHPSVMPDYSDDGNKGNCSTRDQPQRSTNFGGVSTGRDNVQCHAHEPAHHKGGWPYCESDDRRVWVEHLRKLTPVLPYESPLGGIALQEALRDARAAAATKTINVVSGPGNGSPGQQRPSPRSVPPLWSEMPIVIPGSPETDVTPSAFALGEPRSGADTAAWLTAFTHSAATAMGLEAAGAVTRSAGHGGGEEDWVMHAGLPTDLQAIAAILAHPTEPLVDEQDPDEYTGSDGVRQACRRRVDEPNLTERFLLPAGGGDKRRLAASPLPKPTNASTAAVKTSSTATPASASRPDATPATERRAAASEDGAHVVAHTVVARAVEIDVGEDASTAPSPLSVAHSESVHDSGGGGGVADAGEGASGGATDKSEGWADKSAEGSLESAAVEMNAMAVDADPVDTRGTDGPVREELKRFTKVEQRRVDSVRALPQLATDAVAGESEGDGDDEDAEAYDTGEVDEDLCEKGSYDVQYEEEEEADAA